MPDTLPNLFEQDAEPAPASAAIVPRATVKAMVARRKLALEAFERAHVAAVAAQEAFDEAKAAHRKIDQRAREDAYISLTRQEEDRFIKRLDVPEVADFMETARKVVDRRMWAVIIELTDLERLMDKEAKDTLRRQLQDEVPEATEENIFATLQQFAADADMIFKRGIANCFSKLDRRFRSHDGWKIGSRVILTYAFDEWGSFRYGGGARDTLHDIDRAFHVLDGGTTPHLYGGICAVIENGRRHGHGKRQSTHESDYFKIQCYMNGNAHVWFKRDDLVKKVNKILGEYYNAPIPEEREPDEDTGLHRPKTAIAKNFAFYPTPDGPAETVISAASLHHKEDGTRMTVLEPSAGTGNLSRRAAEDRDSRWEWQDGRGNVEIKLGKTCVVDCIEVHGDRATDLEASGLYRKVLAADFLSVQPDPANLYDRVIMNPPFDLERDIDHVMHALEFLKPDGCLVSIMSAGTEFRETKKSIAFRTLMSGRCLTA